ncbi:SDR family oxidoreductase [Lentzea sp.]|uniref:SDR family NAD(P)-dependent oxidoreductase n=1 Tax=Lentzea sp. TaxID=56099 RepID=UPI002ED2A0C9
MATKILANQKALVTGATSGIGRAIAVKLAEAGATVYLTGRRAELGKETVELVEKAGGTGHFIVSDIASVDDVRALAAEVGEVDVLVNNAGIFPFSPTTEQSLETYQQVFDVNVRGVYFLTAALAPAMLAKGRGSIVNVSSIGADVGNATTSVYSASKAAVDALTRSWAVEFGARGVRVNSVAPGPIRTEAAATGSPEVFDAMSDAIPMKRVGEPEEIADVVLFLASGQSSYVNGVVLAADGGYLAS